MVRFARKPQRGRRPGPKAKALGRRRKANINARKSRLATLRRPRRVGRLVSTAVKQTASVFSRGTVKRMAKGITALGAPSQYIVNTGYDMLTSMGVPSVLPGTQGSVIIGQWNSPADIQNLAVNVPTTNTLIGTSPTKFYLKSFRGESTLANTTGTTMIVDLYDIVCIRDIPKASATSPLLGVQTPLTAWATGMAQQNLTAGSPGVLDTPGSVPTDSGLFKDYYRVLSKKTLVMHQGAVHIHKVNLKMGKTLDLGQLTVEVAYLAGYKGFTYYTMAIINGQPCNNTATVAGNSSTILTPPFLRWTNREHYEYTHVQAQGSITTYQMNMTLAGSVDVLNLNSPTAGSQIVS